MRSTHFSLHYHIVFSTRDYQPLIAESWRGRLQAFLGGEVRLFGGVPEAIGGTADHVHLLVSLRATDTIDDLLSEIKRSSSQWIINKLAIKDFQWQEGYGAFTVSAFQIAEVKNYIEAQPEHHRRRSFQQEYLDFLKYAGIHFQ